MNRNVAISFGLHTLVVIITAMSLPFLAKKPIDLPPIISVELIQITDKTNIPFAPKAKKIIEKDKEKEKKLVSEQAPPKKIKKQKPDAVPLPDEKIEKIKKIKDKKQNPEKVKTEIKQISEFEKKELFDTNNIAALIDKSKVESAKTNIPFAPKAKKTIEKIKEKEKKIVSEQAPPKMVKKEKPDAVPLPDEKIEKIKKIKDKKQNPEKIVTEIKQVSEFEKKDLFDPNSIAALIDKSKVESSVTNKKFDKVTQDQDKSIDFGGLSLSEEDALKAQIFGCWSIPLGLPYNENLLVRIKLQLKPDGSIVRSEILDHARMNKPGQGFYKVLAESALRAVKLCQPLRVPSTGYERWKELQLNFDAREMLEG